jgi:cell division protein FtsQ
MWDNAPVLRSIANALLVFSVCGVLYGAAYYTAHLPGLFPLHSVRLSAALQRVDAAGVLQAVHKEVRGNFFTADIERLRLSLEKLPWVRGVSIRREFPYRLEVQLEEHQALARWNKRALVNQQGEVFVVGSERVMSQISGTSRPHLDGDSEQVLPSFIGPDGTAAEVTQHYAQFNRQLAMLNLQAAQITLSPRHAWQLYLSNGMILELGREYMQQRLARFVEVYPYSLAALQSKVKYVDLRYRNGFAVSGLTKQG